MSQFKQKHKDPTPAQIKAMCRMIRAGWSPGVEQSRRCADTEQPTWNIPQVKKSAET